LVTVAPNILVVLDRSDSMNEPLGTSTKWDAAKGALAELAGKYGQGARLGLALYPGTDLSCATGANCEAGAVFVEPA
jgi:hypothetical protein